MSPHKVDIIIPGWGNFPLLRRCLRSLATNINGADYRVYYIDNGSEPNEIALLVNDFPYINIVHLPDPVGFIRATNIGLSLSLMSPAPFVMWLNNDTEIRKGDNEWLDRLLAPFEQGDVGAVGPISDNVAGVQKREAPIGMDGDWIEVPVLIGFAMVIRKELVRALGFCDERFGQGNYEDFDYSMRIRQAGYKLVINEQCWIDHRGHSTFSKMGMEFNTLLRRNLQLLIDKWGVENMRLLGLSVESGDAPVTPPDSAPDLPAAVRLITHATPNWIGNAAPYLASLSKHSPFENWLLIVNGDGEYTLPDKVLYKPVPQTPGAPEVTHSLQHGSFLPYVPGPDDDLLIYTDADIVMQRPPNDLELALINSLRDDEVAVGYNSGPDETLALEASRLGPRFDIATAFEPALLNAKCYNIGVIAARRSTWRKIHAAYMELYPLAYQVFIRQQRQQWLVCYVMAKLGLGVRVLPYTVHMHGCYSLPQGGSVNGTANYNGEVVLFRHHV